MQNHLIGTSSSLHSHAAESLGVGLLGGASHSLVSPPLPKEELKSHFATREGTYRLMTLAEYSRPNRVPLNQAGNTISCAPVRVSFLSVAASPNRATPNLLNGSMSDDDPMRDAETVADRICFNIGRELYVYLYKGTTNAADLSKPIDKRVYKGTYPTCHNFNQETATSTSCSLLIGFSAGQVQLIDPFQKDFTVSRLFNEERLIDKTAVTHIRWVPGQAQHFLVAHASGSMYLYHEDLPCPQIPPVYQMFKQGERFTVYTCKAKTTRNPIYRWQIGEGAIHQFAFSCSDSNILATVGHDGYLRIFNYQAMELLTFMKSYFGGLLCLAWSPDGNLVATGGEDDLLTVYSFTERRVICRGLGHKSWISQVAFDPYTCTLDSAASEVLLEGNSEEDIRNLNERGTTSNNLRRRPPTTVSSASRLSFVSGGTPNGQHSMGVSYRLGSVGHDTQLCLWDITDDVLKHAAINSQRHRNSTLLAPLGELQISARQSSDVPSVSPSNTINSSGAAPSKETKKKRLQRRGFTFAAKLGGSNVERRSIADSQDASSSSSNALDDSRLLGTRFCPRMAELPLIEPLICKKISHERLTVLEFRKDCFVTACQEGFICTWARPGKGPLSMAKRENAVGSPPGVPHTAEAFEYGTNSLVMSSGAYGGSSSCSADRDRAHPSFLTAQSNLGHYWNS